jgi:hypothetical protein
MADMLESRGSLFAVTIESADSAEEQDLFDSIIAKAARVRMSIEPNAIVFKVM